MHTDTLYSAQRVAILWVIRIRCDCTCTKTMSAVIQAMAGTRSVAELMTHRGRVGGAAATTCLLVAAGRGNGCTTMSLLCLRHLCRRCAWRSRVRSEHQLPGALVLMPSGLRLYLRLLLLLLTELMLIRTRAAVLGMVPCRLDVPH